jgi:putative NADH-flavin reductase
MATLLVIGASRGIGLETVRRALAAGHRVRAFARGAAAIPVEAPALEEIPGDALDQANVTSAVFGADAVIQSLGASHGPQSILGGTTIFSEATRILVDAMRATGVRRLVAVTGLGAGDSRGHGGFLYDALIFPLVLKRIYDDKDVQEQMIKVSGLEWTIVRPGLLTSGPATGQARALVDPSEWRAGSVSRADVADFLVREAFERRFVGKTPLLIR